MGLVTKTANNVARWSDDGPSDWTPLNAVDAEACLDKDATGDTLASLFPGPCFFGRLVGPCDLNEMRIAMSVLRTVLGMHEMLYGGSALLEEPDTAAMDLAARIERMVHEEGSVQLSRGTGYEDIDEDDDSLRIPTCHIYRCEVPFSEQYAKWLRPRLDTMNALGSVMLAQDVFFLKLFHQMKVEDDGKLLVVDVYGTWSLLSDWDEWLEQYEKTVPDDIVLTGIELVAGLLHLADTLSTLHLASAVPQVSYGRLESASADDSLTDLWFMCYDPTENKRLYSGTCEVCGRLFVSSKKKTRGHSDCMNRRRVMRSRAKQYAIRVEGGISPEDAARSSSISIAAAREMLEGDQYKFREGIDYWGISLPDNELENRQNAQE